MLPALGPIPAVDPLAGALKINVDFLQRGAIVINTRFTLMKASFW